MPALPAIAIGVTVAATAASIASAAAQSKAQQQAANYNAQMQQFNAQILTGQAQADASNVARTGEINQGKVQAAAAASGLGSTGSVQDVTYSNLVANQQDALAAKYRGTVQAYNATNQAGLDSMEASNAQSSGYLNEGSALLSGASKIYGAYNGSYGGGSVSPIFGATTTQNQPGF